MDSKILIGLIIILVVGAIFMYIPSTGIPVSGETGSVVDANNKFAIDMYSELKSEEGNIFFSPFSISTALAMTYEGAKGETAEQMKQVFYFPENNSEMRSQYLVLNSQINSKSDSFQLSTANALWAQKDYPFLSEYLNTVETYYGGKATELDFVGNTEGSRQTINAWVEEKTNNKIKDLIPVDALTTLTRLVLTNAVYFKGTWFYQFDTEATQEDYFKLDNEEYVKVQMMNIDDEEIKFNYTENDDIQMLELPYDGDKLSMLLILPENNMQNLESKLTLENLNKWKQDLEEQRVKVFIPKFKLETDYSLKEPLMGMGMPLAFGGRADFSGMTGNPDLFIVKVLHKAFVEVNEEGTEAAAATAVIMAKAVVQTEPKPQIPVFRADHPFVFIIQQKDSGNILFIGRVSDPS